MASSTGSHPQRFAVSLFLLSLAAVLYSLSLFRLIGFFIMPSLFFDLLLVGFPVGAALAAMWKGEPAERFPKALTVFQVTMFLTIVATLSLKHFDFMRENLLFGQNPFRILAQISIFSLIYSPFFVAYGATEYVGYLAGRTVLSQKMSGVYSIVLFGAAGAFLVARLQETIGVARLLVVAIGILTLIKVILGDGFRRRHMIELALVAAVLLNPGTDEAFMRFFKSSKPFTVAEYKSRGDAKQLHSGWGRYSYFEILQQKLPHDTANIGFYNDMSQWFYVLGTPEPDFREVALQPLIEGAESVAVIGAGGGRDVKLARAVGVKKIVALEVEPAVPRVIQGKLKDEFENVYSQPDVTVHVGDARTYLTNSTEQFDAIFFWSVGGYPQLMLEPGNMVRTSQALRTYLERLSDRGVFIIGYDYGLDPDRVLLRQYATTLSEHGAHVYAFEFDSPPQQYVLVAFSPTSSVERVDEVRTLLRDLPRVARGLPIHEIPRAELVQERFSPVTDDQPYLAGNIRNVLTREDVQFLFHLLTVALLLISLGIYFFFLGPPKDVTQNSLRVHVLAFMLGANFLMLEHLCVLEIFRHRYVYYDAVLLGVTVFLTVTGIGSLLVRNRWLTVLTPIAALAAMVWLGGLQNTFQLASALILAVQILLTGAMFPTLFERHEPWRLHIFTMDAIGAAFGALLAFFIPIMFGFAVFQTLAMSVFLGTVALMFWEQRSRSASDPSAIAQSVES